MHLHRNDLSSSQTKILKTSQIDTPIGPMVAIGDEKALYLLEFVDRRGLEKEIERLGRKAEIIHGSTEPLCSIGKELRLYFEGNLTQFQTPICYLGSPFQIRVWEELQKIPKGETRSYIDTAKALRYPSACRAVARANGTNQIAIVIPCHRVINANGELGGYSGGVARKKWLLNHERAI